MPAELTVVARVWPRQANAGEARRYELWENFRPTWRSCSVAGLGASCLLETPVATMLALDLACDDLLDEVTALRIPSDVRQPLALSAGDAHAIYRAYRGSTVALVRFAGSLVADRELACLRQAGVDVDIWNPETDSGLAIDWITQ